MREEALLMEHIKTAVSFVSTNLQQDLKTAKSSSALKLDYVLPDGLSQSRGYARVPVLPTKGDTRAEQVSSHSIETHVIGR